MYLTQGDQKLTIRRLPEISVGDVTLPVYQGNDNNLYTELEPLLRCFSKNPNEQKAALLLHPMLNKGLETVYLEGNNNSLKSTELIRADMLALFLVNLNLENMKSERVYQLVASIQQEAGLVLAEALASGRLVEPVKTSELLENGSTAANLYKELLVVMNFVREQLYYEGVYVPTDSASLKPRL